MKSLRNYIHEASNIGHVKKTMQFDIIINKSDHAEERQGRHGYDDYTYIEDEEIYEICRRGTPQIIDALIYGKVEANVRSSRFIVQDPYTKVSLVCGISGNVGADRMKLTVITTMRGDFRNIRNSYTIVLND